MGLLHNQFGIRHVISSAQFGREALACVFEGADDIAEKFAQGRRHEYAHALDGAVVASYFFEPSTRTRWSFESGTHRMGGSVITTENAEKFSSAVKGERLEDSVRVIGHYADAIVMRHKRTGAAELAANYAKVPVINAGDGTGEHPTQAMLDLYTIKKLRGTIDGVNIAIVGDLRLGRTVRSLAKGLCNYKKVTVHFVAPDILQVSPDVVDYLALRRVKFQKHSNINEVLADMDCIYMTRTQRERMTAEEDTATKNADTEYGIGTHNLHLMRPDQILMHPLPRNNEIEFSPLTDGRAKSVYLDDQIKAGLHVRAFLLKDLLN